MALLSTRAFTHRPRKGRDVRETSELIKQRLTIPMIGRELFPGWECVKNPCCSPFVEQRTGSFSVSRDGTKFNDFSNPDHKGDVIDFYRIAKGLDARTAFKDLAARVDGQTFTPIIRAPSPVRDEKVITAHPTLRIPSITEIRKISHLRSIAPEALQIAVDRGLLWTATSIWQACETFILTDSRRINYRIRRLDGQKFSEDRKALCIKGSQASWPIGLPEAAAFPCIALCEGEGDTLAAFGHALACGTEASVAPVCMSGASNRIPSDALPLFAGKRVRIFVQADRAGEDAWNLWRGQLDEFAEKIDGFDFGGYTMEPDGTTVTDLNDALKIDVDCWERHKQELENVMVF